MRLNVLSHLRQWILLAAFLITPYGIVTAGVINQSHKFFLFASALAIMGCIVSNRYWSIFLWYAALWQLTIFISAMLLPGLIDRILLYSIGMATYLIIGAAIFHAVSVSKTSKTLYFNIICIAAFLQAALGISQVFGIDPFEYAISIFMPVDNHLPVHTVTGTLGNNNFYAAFIAISLPFFLRRGWCFSLPLLVAALVMSNTRAAYIAVAFGAAYYFWTKRTRIWMLVGGAAITAICFFAYPARVPGLSGRLPWWKDAITKTCSTVGSFIFGYGPGTTWGSYPLHNEYVDLFFNYGIIIVILMGLYFVDVFRYGTDRILIAAFIVTIIDMAANHCLHLAPSAFLILIIVGLIERDHINQIEGGIT